MKTAEQIAEKIEALQDKYSEIIEAVEKAGPLSPMRESWFARAETIADRIQMLEWVLEVNR